MNQQQGISSTGIALVVVVVAAAGGGYFAWQQHGELQLARNELAETKSSLDKASAEARTARSEADAARKALDEQKAALAQLRSEHDSAVAFLETEKAHSAHLQAELTLAQQQMAFLRARPAAASAPAYARPSVVPIQPLRIQAAPGGRSYGAAQSAAPAPMLQSQPPH